jgi:triosephosphate isomerase
MPILCIAEDGARGRQGLTKWWLLKQMKAALETVRPQEAGRMAIAYQPGWAANTSRDLAPGIAGEAAAFMRSCVLAVLGSAAADSVRLLYGGAVDGTNIEMLMAQPDVDGVIVEGRSGLHLDSLLSIAQFEGVTEDQAAGIG